MRTSIATYAQLRSPLGYFSTLFLEDGAAHGRLGLPTSMSVKLNEDHLLANQSNLDNLSLSRSGQRILGCVSDSCCYKASLCVAE